MNKRVLLIGNNNGLSGVQIDFTNYQSFFISDLGGDWYPSEIISKMNPSLSEMRTTLSELKKQSLDFLIVLFSGHAGQARETILELNAKGDTISEIELRDISLRQITIFDCCRAHLQPVELSESVRMFAKSAQVLSYVRQRYEQRIMQAIPQQVRLYSCSVGETSYDTPSGGAYSKYLLAAARTVSEPFRTVGVAHSIASGLTKKEYTSQNPEAFLPRCLSTQELVLSIKP
jgi:hypothetical protein